MMLYKIHHKFKKHFWIIFFATIFVLNPLFYSQFSYARNLFHNKLVKCKILADRTSKFSIVFPIEIAKIYLATADKDTIFIMAYKNQNLIDSLDYQPVILDKEYNLFLQYVPSHNEFYKRTKRNDEELIELEEKGLADYTQCPDPRFIEEYYYYTTNNMNGNLIIRTSIIEP